MTDYNVIAQAYRETKSLPVKQYSEAFTFFQVLESVHGLAVLDVACGDGYYTRALKRQGASRVVGVDSSHMMITYAQREEEAHPLGIEYVVGEAETMEILGVFDIVTAAYLLVHATTRYQLAAMCQAIAKQLKPGGRLVALTINPHLVLDQLPPVEQYQSGVTAQGPLQEGTALDITMLTASGPVHICDYYWSQVTYESVLQQAGFGMISWHAMRVSAEGFQTYGSAYWQDYLNHPHIVVLGSTPDGRAFPPGEDRTCGNWTKSGQGAAMVGHHDRMGLNEEPPAKSWNSSHPSRGPDGGCSQADLRSTGGDGLFYCFAAN